MAAENSLFSNPTTNVSSQFLPPKPMTADTMRPSSSMSSDPTKQKSEVESLASLFPHLKRVEAQPDRGDIANQPQVVNPKQGPKTGTPTYY